MDEQNQRKEITVRGKQEAIIPEEMWDRVQEKRKRWPSIMRKTNRIGSACCPD